MSQPDTSTAICVTCDHPTHDAAQTCLNCVNHARNLLTDIYEGWTLLPDAIKTLTGISYSHTPGRTDDTHIPGGDALVMLSPGTANTVQAIHDHRLDDPPSLAGELATIEDDWRHVLHTEAAPYAPSVTSSIRWMVANIAHIAQAHPDWPNQLSYLRALRNRVTAVTGTTDTPEKVESAGCLDCGGTLIRQWTPHGLNDTVECHACARTYTHHSYRLALRQKLQDALHEAPDAPITAREAHDLYGIKPGTIRQWENRRKITPTGTRRGEKTYRITDLHTLAGENISA